jgi:hypothetical protein
MLLPLPVRSWSGWSLTNAFHVPRPLGALEVRPAGERAARVDDIDQTPLLVGWFSEEPVHVDGERSAPTRAHFAAADRKGEGAIWFR